LSWASTRDSFGAPGRTAATASTSPAALIMPPATATCSGLTAWAPSSGLGLVVIVGDFALGMLWLKRLTRPVVGARFLTDPGQTTGPRR